jgi:hypothetical protein
MDTVEDLRLEIVVLQGDLKRLGYDASDAIRDFLEDLRADPEETKIKKLQKQIIRLQKIKARVDAPPNPSRSDGVPGVAPQLGPQAILGAIHGILSGMSTATGDIFCVGNMCRPGDVTRMDDQHWD